jgi:hypothetical protein
MQLYPLKHNGFTMKFKASTWHTGCSNEQHFHNLAQTMEDQVCSDEVFSPLVVVPVYLRKKLVQRVSQGIHNVPDIAEFDFESPTS